MLIKCVKRKPISLVGNFSIEVTLSSEAIAIIAIGATILIAVIGGHIAQVRRIGQLPTRDEMNAAIQASEARIIKALVNHRHPEPDGPPVFTEPV